MGQRLTALYQTMRRADYRALEMNLQTHSTQPMSRFVVDVKTMTLKNMTTGESRALRCRANSTLWRTVSTSLAAPYRSTHVV